MRRSVYKVYDSVENVTMHIQSKTCYNLRSHQHITTKISSLKAALMNKSLKSTIWFTQKRDRQTFSLR
jgi:hypothetical protein